MAAVGGAADDALGMGETPNAETLAGPKHDGLWDTQDVNRTIEKQMKKS